MDIDNIIKGLESIKNNVDNQVKRIAIKNKEEILDYIREKQLFEKGEDGKGRKLTAYKPFTIAYKKLKLQPTNRTTLFDTGSFYKNFDLLITDQSAIGVFSRDSKTPKILEKYEGFSIFEFQESNRKEIDEDIFYKQLSEWLAKELQKITI